MMLEIYQKAYIRKAPAVMYPEGLGGREVCSRTAAGRKEYDKRRGQLEDRQKHKCAICGNWNMNMEFDHQAGRGANAGHRDDRILDEDGNWMNAALCTRCNTKKGSKRYEWRNKQYVQVIKEAICRETIQTSENLSETFSEEASTPPLRYKDFFKSRPAG